MIEFLNCSLWWSTSNRLLILFSHFPLDVNFYLEDEKEKEENETEREKSEEVREMHSLHGINW